MSAAAAPSNFSTVLRNFATIDDRAMKMPEFKAIISQYDAIKSARQRRQSYYPSADEREQSRLYYKSIESFRSSTGEFWNQQLHQREEYLSTLKSRLLEFGAEKDGKAVTKVKEEVLRELEQLKVGDDTRVFLLYKVDSVYKQILRGEEGKSKGR